MSRLIDWSTLHLESGSYVDKSLKDKHSDLLFSVKFNNKTALLYLLLEHQSTEDVLMAYRMLGYEVRILDRYLLKHPETEIFPPIIPIVLYHGKKQWSAAQDVRELIDWPDGYMEGWLEPHLPHLKFILDDITSITEGDLSARGLEVDTALVLRVLSRTRPLSKNITSELENWFASFSIIIKKPNGYALFEAIVEYVLRVTDMDVIILKQVFEPLSSRVEDIVITTAERLMLEGEKRGIKIGEERGEKRGEKRGIKIGEELGEERGIKIGISRFFVSLLTSRFGGISLQLQQRIQEADEEQLQKWSKQLLDAQTLQDIFPDE